MAWDDEYPDPKCKPLQRIPDSGSHPRGVRTQRLAVTPQTTSFEQLIVGSDTL